MSPIPSRKKTKSSRSSAATGSAAIGKKLPHSPQEKPKSTRGGKTDGHITPAEKRRIYMALLDAFPSPAWVKDADGVFLAINQAWTKLFERSREETIGRNDAAVFGEEQGFKVHQQDLETIRTGVPQQFEECFEIGGRRVWVDTVISPFADGGKVGTAGITRNITQQKQMEERFLRTQRMESLGALVGGIAHDLNNILGPILMATSMLDENVKQDANRELVAIVKEAAQRGAEIVSQVLAFARGTRAQRKPLEPKLLIRQMGRILQKVMPKSIAFSTDLADDLSNITGDATQLHQVFMNLCVNARDAMPCGGTLTLRGRNALVDEAMAGRFPEAQPGHYVCITVADTGVGIPEEIREKIYDPFFTTKEVGKGTGLGLSTALAIVKNHGGFVMLESEVGKGSLFSVYLPATEHPLLPENPKAQAPLPAGNGELILVVDDELPICKMAEAILQKKGYRVLTALSGREALRLFAAQRGKIRAVLSDLAMPEMSGAELIKALLAKDPGLPVIASTGQSSEQRYQDLAGLNVKWRLSKPYGALQLLSVVAEAVAQRPR